MQHNQPVRKVFKNVGFRYTNKEKHKILSKPQIGYGIFTMLATTFLPAFVSLLTR